MLNFYCIYIDFDCHECPNEIIQKIEEMKVRINKYEKNYDDKKQSLGAPVSLISIVSNEQEQQEIELKGPSNNGQIAAREPHVARRPFVCGSSS